METNINLANKDNLKKTKDTLGWLTRLLLLLGITLFPWIILPGSSQPTEFYREIFVFFLAGFLLILMFLHFLKRKEFEWRRTKLNWILGVWIIVLALIFLYSRNHKIAWEGYPGSFTAGFSEYLALTAIYFLAVQLSSFAEWKKITQYFLVSVSLVLFFSIAAAVYFQNLGVLSVNFARTPSLVVASSGVTAMALWWVSKRTEAFTKTYVFVLALSLFFISSLLDFYVGWFMWAAGTLVLLLFDLASKTGTYLREKEEIKLGVSRSKGSLLSVFFQGDTKYLFLILFFTLSRFFSQVFLKGQKIEFLPFFSYFVKYPILGQKVFFYSVLNLIVFCFGIYYFFRLKKERTSIVLVVSSLVSVSVGHLFYYSESIIFFLLNWILVIYAGLTFLRKPPERDFFYIMEPGSKGKKVFVIAGTIFLAIIAGLIIIRVASL